MRELFSTLKSKTDPKVRLPVATVATSSVPADFNGNSADGKLVTLVAGQRAKVTPVTRSPKNRLPTFDNQNNMVTGVTQVTTESHLKASLVDSDDEFRERAAIATFDGQIPAGWSEEFAALQVMALRYDTDQGRRNELVNDAGLFLDRWASTAIAQGWTSADVFGLYHEPPHSDLQCVGLVSLIQGGSVTGITAGAITIRYKDGIEQDWYRHQMPCMA